MSIIVLVYRLCFPLSHPPSRFCVDVANHRRRRKLLFLYRSSNPAAPPSSATLQPRRGGGNPARFLPVAASNHHLLSSSTTEVSKVPFLQSTSLSPSFKWDDNNPDITYCVLASTANLASEIWTPICQWASKESHRLFLCPPLRSTFIPVLQLVPFPCPDNPSFKIPLRFPMDIHDELGFVFLETEMTKAAEEYKFAIVMKFLRVRPFIDVIRLNVGHTAVVCRAGERRKEVGKPKENITWQPKKFDIKGSSSGTKDDKEMEANIASLGERLQNMEGESAETNQSGQVPSFLLNTEMSKDPLQDLVYILENENDVSEEECDEVWCDKENEVALEFMQLKDKESSELPKNLVDEMKNILAENRLLWDFTMGYCSSQEEGEVIVSRGKEKAYDSEGANRSDVGKCKKITSDKTVRKS
ncbi:hypothetical protein ACLOJK_022793 [Asimina triloba]